MPDPAAVSGVIAFGIAYGLSGYTFKGRPEGERLSLRKLLRTVVLYGVASAIVFYGGEAVTEQTIENEAISGVGIFVGLVFDMAWSYLRNEGYLPGALSAGG